MLSQLLAANVSHRMVHMLDVGLLHLLEINLVAEVAALHRTHIHGLVLQPL